MKIRPYQETDRLALVELWRRCGLLSPANDPQKDIDRKLKVRPDLLVVAIADEAVVGSVMIGYEGHRGWLNYLAVSPERQNEGCGRALVAEAERLLRLEGCPKINLQVRTSNRAAVAFYEALGFVQDDVISLGKRLERDGPDAR